MRKLSIYLFIVAALLVAAIPSVAGAQTPPPDTTIPAPSPVAHPSRQDARRRALRRRRRPALPRLRHVLQRGRLGARAAHTSTTRASTTPSWRRSTSSPRRPSCAACTRATSARTRAASTRATAARASRTTALPRQEARARARHRRDVAVELRRDRGRQLHLRPATRRPRRRRDRRSHRADARALQPRQAERRGGVLHHRPAREHAGPHREQPQARGLRRLAAAVPQARRLDGHHRPVQERRPGGHRAARATASSPTSATSTPTWPAATRTSASSSPTRSTSCHRLAAWPATSTCSTPLSCVTSSPACAPRSRTPDRPRRPARRSGPPSPRLLADPAWLPERFQEGDPDSGMGGGIGQWLLFRAEDRSLSLFSLVVPSGAQTPVHDHLAWGLVGPLPRHAGRGHLRRARRRHRARREPRAGARRLLRADPADRRHPPRAHDLAADVGLDPPAHERHRLRLAPRLRRATRASGHAVSLGLRQRALRRRRDRAMTLHRRLELAASCSMRSSAASRRSSSSLISSSMRARRRRPSSIVSDASAVASSRTLAAYSSASARTALRVVLGLLAQLGDVGLGLAQQLLGLLLGGEQDVRGRLAHELELARDRDVPEVARGVGLQPVDELLEEAVDLVAVVAAPAEAEAGVAQAIEVLPVHGPGSVDPAP